MKVPQQKKTRKVMLVLLVLYFCFFASTAFAATYNSKSCSQQDVQAAINSATDEDTVIVPAGTCTWTSTLAITKKITLQGSGTGKTVINANMNGYVISYIPANAINRLFRLTGFEFKLGNSAHPYFHRNPFSTPLFSFRMDNNKWTDCVYSRPFLFEGMMWGVVDNNIFQGNPHFDNYGEDDGPLPGNGGEWDWDNTLFSVSKDMGTNRFLIYEDNIFNTGDTLFSGGLGGRYVFRYNTVNPTAGLWPLLDAHGNMGVGGNLGTRGVEVYGNIVTGNQDARVLDLRGGIGFCYYNYVDKSNGMDLQVREEHCDSTSQPAFDPGGQPQHVSNSYFWSNSDSGGSRYFTLFENTCTSYKIANNKDYWDYNPSFNGASGTGCGTIAKRPTTCTTGVGYWATSQPCTDLTGMIGRNLAKPISGTLYKCTSTNTWTAFYTPYTYPHPLRMEAPETCSQLGETCCSSDQTCSGTTKAASGCATCCIGTCQAQQQTCSQQGGNCCATGQTCSGSTKSTSDCNNCCTGTCQSTCIPGDLNCDKKVDIFDLVLVAQNYGKTSGFDLKADANKDGKIDIFDLVIVAQNYGKTG